MNQTETRIQLSSFSFEAAIITPTAHPNDEEKKIRDMEVIKWQKQK